MAKISYKVRMEKHEKKDDGLFFPKGKLTLDVHFFYPKKKR